MTSVLLCTRTLRQSRAAVRRRDRAAGGGAGRGRARNAAARRRGRRCRSPYQ